MVGIRDRFLCIGVSLGRCGRFCVVPVDCVVFPCLRLWARRFSVWYIGLGCRGGELVDWLLGLLDWLEGQECANFRA